ncbi:MAG: crossover junction endodeoxyribonuclease RuvC [Christensenellales bacterium]
MVILGIDPGLAIVGYGAIRNEEGKLSLLEFGAVTTSSGDDFPHRICDVYDGIQYLLDKFSPDAIAIEELFFSKNVKTALMVAQARGVALLCAAKHTSALYEYTPLQVKQAVVGYGRAEKQQVQQMVKILLGLSEIPRPDDAADALAVAICHAHSGKMRLHFKIK